MPRSEVYNIDCMELLRTLPDKAFSLAVADPPYGLDRKSVQGAGKLKDRTLNRHDMGWDVRPEGEFFEELRRVSEHQVIWGGNYFPLGPCRCFVCWDKQQVWENFSQCEMAWTDFDRPAKHVTLSNRGGHADSVGWHPTSKPVELYAYLLRTFATGGGNPRSDDGQPGEPYRRLQGRARLRGLRDRPGVLPARVRAVRRAVPRHHHPHGRPEGHAA